jgi:hypothetical protein
VIHELEMQTLVAETAKAAAARSKEVMVQIATVQDVTGPLSLLARAREASQCSQITLIQWGEGYAKSGISDSPTERIITLRITSERITSERINTQRITS